MAVDKLVDSAKLDADLASIATAIRQKGGTGALLLFPDDFITAIWAIPGGTPIQPSFSDGTLTLSGFESAPSWIIEGGGGDIQPNFSDGTLTLSGFTSAPGWSAE